MFEFSPPLFFIFYTFDATLKTNVSSHDTLFQIILHQLNKGYYRITLLLSPTPLAHQHPSRTRSDPQIRSMAFLLWLELVELWRVHCLFIAVGNEKEMGIFFSYCTIVLFFVYLTRLSMILFPVWSYAIVKI